MKRRFDLAISALSSADLKNLYVTWSDFVSPSQYSSSYFAEGFCDNCICIAAVIDFLKTPDYYPYASSCHMSMVHKTHSEIIYCDLLTNSDAVEAIMEQCYSGILKFRKYFKDIEAHVNHVRIPGAHVSSTRRTMDAMFVRSSLSLKEMVEINRCGICSSGP